MKKKPQQKKQSERGRLLARARRVKGITRAALASQLGVTSAAVSAWEQGIRVPGDQYIPKYAAALGLTPHQLLDILDKP